MFDIPTLMNPPISHRLRIRSGGKEFEIVVDERRSLLENLLKAGIMVDNLCGGRGICGKCAVKVISGSFSPPTDRELRWMKVLKPGMRLSCQVRVLSDAVIELEEVSREIEGKILTWGAVKGLTINPLVKVMKVKLKPPSLQDQKSDLERLLGSLNVKSYDPLIIADLSDALRKSNFEVNVVSYENEIIDVIPINENSRFFGVAVDIGTTTVVAYLYDLISGENLGVESAYNKQIRFGEDVISRVNYARSNRSNLEDLRKAVVDTINELLENLARKTGARKDRIYDAVCAGNTTMLSFLMGNNCYHGSRAPYPPPFTSSVKVKARDLGIEMNPRGYVRTVPSMSMYVGGDIVADILASGLHECERAAALVDLGTNGEIVIRTSEGEFLATSCAAGPALEGYGVRDGMRAVKGAIESVVIDESGKSYYKVIGNTKPEGICGSGIIEAIAWMRIRGIIDKTGKIIENSSERVKRGYEGLKFVIVPASESATGKEIAITQKDIREIQLAKAAIYAALLTLTRVAGMRLTDFEKIFIAGAFGNYLNIFSAQVIGMLPDIPQERFSFIGNGSVIGASMMLLSKEVKEKAQSIAKMVKTVELNVIKDFQSEFIKATYIPHTNEELFKNTLEKINSLRIRKQ